MDLFGRAKQWVKGIGPAEPPEPQSFRVVCPEDHIIRGRRTEGYQALRCPDCGEGVFVLPRSPLPAPPAPSSRADRERLGGLANHGGGFDESPIPFSDHVPDPMHEAEEVDWLEPVDPNEVEVNGVPMGFDPVEAAVSELPNAEDKVGSENATSPTPRPTTVANRSRQGQRPGPARPDPVASRRAPDPGPRILVPDRPSIGDRIRKNRPILVALAVVGIIGGTVTWTLVQNQRRNAPALVQQGTVEGIPALERGEFDRAHRILSKASSAVEALRGQIGGATEIRQAAKEAAIFVDLVPDRLETILDLRARTSDEEVWKREFERSYQGRAILISARVTSSPADSEATYDLNYRILAVGQLSPRQARIDLSGFRLFELGQPSVGTQVAFGARLKSVESDDNGWRFLLEPNSGVTITHVGALQAIGWAPVETANRHSPDPARIPGQGGRDWITVPTLLTGMILPPMLQGLKGETADQVLLSLGAPNSYARSATQGEAVEQWIYEAPSGARQYVNFLRSTSRSGPAVVDRDYFIR